MAFGRRDGQAQSLWVLELARGTISRLTFGSGIDSRPVWSPDGRRIAFTSRREGETVIAEKPSDGSGDEQVLVKSLEQKTPYDWSRDGHYLLYTITAPSPAIWVLPLAGDRRPIEYGKGFSGQGKFSPDGHWIAYRSAESGTNEIYVRPFAAGSGGKWMVSSGNGLEPRWRADGREIFYLSGRKIMAVEVTTMPSFKAGPPKVLFEAPILQSDLGRVHHYDVTADGKKFLINRSLEDDTSNRFDVVVNWMAELKK